MLIKFESFAGKASILGAEHPVTFTDGALAIAGLTSEEVHKVLIRLAGVASELSTAEVKENLRTNVVERARALRAEGAAALQAPKAEAKEDDGPRVPTYTKEQSLESARSEGDSAVTAGVPDPAPAAEPKPKAKRVRVEKPAPAPAPALPEDLDESEAGGGVPVPARVLAAEAAAIAPAAATYANGVREMPEAIVQEIRGAYGMNPALLSPAVKKKIVLEGVRVGMLPPLAKTDDVEERFYVLGSLAPVGWFTDVFESLKVVALPAKTVAAMVNAAASKADPAGLTPDGEGDPDQDELDRSTPVGRAALADLIEPLQAAQKLREVIVMLIDKGGAKTTEDVVAMCEELHADLPLLSRVPRASVRDRVERTIALVAPWGENADGTAKGV